MPPAPVASSDNLAGQEHGRYILKVVRQQFMPMAGGCYEELLHRHPDAAGKLFFKVNVISDPSVGAVVDSAELTKDSTLIDPEMTTCVIESMKSVDFAASPGGTGEFNFIYPIEFAPGPPPEDPSGAKENPPPSH